MKRLIAYSLLLILSVWIGLKMHTHPGYVLISYSHWSLETTFWVALLATLILFLFGYAILGFTNKISSVTKYLQQWFGSRKQRKTIQGLLELAEGNWKNAEKKLIHSVNFHTGVINYLAAAFAAQKQQQILRRDLYLAKAQQQAQKQGGKNIVPGLIQTQLQIENKQWEEALATLQQLKQLNPRNILVLKYLQQVLLEFRDWHNLQKLLPSLRKRKIITANQLEQLEETIYRELLMQAVVKPDALSSDVTKFWQQLPGRLKIKANILLIYIEHLLNKNPDLAETLIKNALKKTWNEKLVEKYGLISSNYPLKQLRTAENWLKHHPQNIKLLISLSKICQAQQLWGPARFYLEKSLKIAPTPEAYFELGTIAESQGQTATAMELYKKAAG